MDKSQNEGKITLALLKISGSITGLAEKIEHIKGRMPERLAVSLYLVGHILMMFVHEPWFDEALAWLIARDSSLYEILFVAPHYEGHPSLWHLVLMPFAKLGAPYELSLNLVSLIFSGIAVVLFIYKAPFKRIIRLLIPFTYFFFYQYSVVSRPYCMLMLAFVLMAMTYKNRSEQPGRFILTLWFMCLTCAYGMVVACGICFVWLIEMFAAAHSSSVMKNSDNGESRGVFRIFFEDHLVSKGRLFWLLFLLGYALFIVYRINPADDAFAVLKSDSDSGMSFMLRLLYTSVGILSDLVITNTYSSGITLSTSGLGFIDVLPAISIGAAILIFILLLAKRKKMLALFVVPYSMLAIVMAYLYMSRHHMGIVLLFLIFFMWVYTEKEPIKEPVKKEDTHVSDNKLNTSLGLIMLAIFMAVPIYWNISSVVVDIFTNYSLGRAEYTYLEENDFLKNTILAEWNEMPGVEEGEIKPISFSGVITDLLPYMDEDVFINSPAKAGYNYSEIHKLPSGDVNLKLLDSINSEELPDIIIGEPDYSVLGLKKDFNLNDYVTVFEKNGGIIWKGVPEMDLEKIYVKRSLVLD